MGEILIRQEEGQDSRRRTVSFSSETPYRRYFGMEILDHAEGAVDLGRLNSVGVLLFNHDVDKVVGRVIRVMIVGVPNVGKSSLINRLCKGGKADVADRPGVTRQNRWFTIGKGFELLDTPGVLWPKFEDKLVGEKLAFTGAVKDDVVDTEHLASRLLEFLSEEYPKELKARYKLDEIDLSEYQGYELLEMIGKIRGMLVSGGEINTERASIAVLDEFRGAVIGRITLETPREAE